MNKTKALLLSLVLLMLTWFALDAQTVFRSIRQFAEILIVPGLRIVPSSRDNPTNVFNVFDLGSTNYFRIQATGTNALPVITSNGVPYVGVTATIGASNYNIGSSVANGFRLYTFRNGLLISTNSQ